MDDLEAVREACTLCSEVGAQVCDRRAASKYGRTIQNDVEITGITENIPRIGTVRELMAGRHLMQRRRRAGARRWR